jgi:hypothetical protein
MTPIGSIARALLGGVLVAADTGAQGRSLGPTADSSSVALACLGGLMSGNVLMNGSVLMNGNLIE